MACGCSSLARYPRIFNEWLFSGKWGGGGEGLEERPGTEKGCPNNLQSGPVEKWIAVFIIINISEIS